MQTTLFDGKYLRLLDRDHWQFVQRKNISGIVGIIAVTPQRRLLLVEQYRIPLQARVIEIPAGLAGDQPGTENEPLIEAARRELLEETGYHADTWRQVAQGTSSSGLTDEVITLFVASGLRKVAPGGGDGSERITVHDIPLNEVEPWLARQLDAGAKVDLKVYSALYFARHA